MKKILEKISLKYLYCSIFLFSAMEESFAQGSGDMATSSRTIGDGMRAIITILPLGSQILGFIIAGGGLFQIHKYHKSQGRDGSMGGGIAGIAIGVCMFALGGFLKWTGQSIGVSADNGGCLPPACR